MSLVLLLKLCCVCWLAIPSVLGHNLIPNQDVLNAIKQSIAQAQAELGMERAINQQLYELGIDGTPRERCPFKQMDQKPPASDAAGVGFVIYRATQLLTKILGKSVDQLKMHQNVRAIWQAQISHICTPRRPRCKRTRYRTMDGSCNNVRQPTWGMAGRPQKRYLPAAYKDGVAMPRMFSVTGQPLSSARVISNVVHQNFDTSVLTEFKDSAMLMVFGVVMTLDAVGTPSSKGHKGVTPNCCGTPPQFLKKRSACFTIAVPPNDKRFKNCMGFSRTSAYAKDHCQFCQQQQGNGATGYLDGSILYGNSDSESATLRMFKKGLLQMTKFGFPPPSKDQTKCIREKPQDYCMKSGEPKINLVPPLTSIIGVFLREHNRIAPKLAYLNSHWNDERIFQETRKIIGALLQHIGYNEYLPIILGPAFMAKYGLFSSKMGFRTAYNPKLDASTVNAWAAAAFRFGHSQIPNQGGIIFKNGNRVDVDLKDLYMRPGPITSDGPNGPDNVNRWVVSVNGAKSDRIVESAARDYMLLDEFGNSFDLAAYNIQRGRDHGLPGYNKWRKLCGLSPAFHFASTPGGLVDIDPKAAMLLSKVYTHPDDIDLFTGGLSEARIPGGRVGPTFACIIAEQFRARKYGDKFWYENNFKTGFTKGQLNEIKKVRLSSVLCNTMKEHAMQPDVFKIPDTGNPRVSCSALPQINLWAWKETPFRRYK